MKRAAWLLIPAVATAGCGTSSSWDGAIEERDVPQIRRYRVRIDYPGSD